MYRSHQSSGKFWIFVEQSKTTKKRSAKNNAVNPSDSKQFQFDNQVVSFNPDYFCCVSSLDCGSFCIHSKIEYTKSPLLKFNFCILHKDPQTSNLIYILRIELNLFSRTTVELFTICRIQTNWIILKLFWIKIQQFLVTPSHPIRVQRVNSTSIELGFQVAHSSMKTMSRETLRGQFELDSK